MILCLEMVEEELNIHVANIHEAVVNLASVMVNVHITGGSQGVGFVGRVAAMMPMCQWQDGVHVALELGGGTQRMLAHSIAYEGGTPRGCRGKCRT